MIEGIKIDIPATELKALLKGRLEYHQERKAFYQKQYDLMAEAAKGDEERRSTLGKVSNSTPLESMQSSIEKHHNNIVYYTFLHDHVVPNETYRLEESDLLRLGISSGRGF